MKRTSDITNPPRTTSDATRQAILSFTSTRRHKVPLTPDEEQEFAKVLGVLQSAGLGTPEFDEAKKKFEGSWFLELCGNLQEWNGFWSSLPIGHDQQTAPQNASIGELNVASTDTVTHALESSAPVAKPGKEDKCATPKVCTLPLADISTTSDTASRVLNPGVVAEYKDCMESGVAFPPVVVFSDGCNFFLGDGFHRHEATKQCQKAEIDVEIREGDRKAALIYSLGANSQHGYRRTNEDKRFAVNLALKEFLDLSDHAIAKICRVSHTFVGAQRKEFQAPTGNVSSSERQATTGNVSSPPAKPAGPDGKQRSAPKRKDGKKCAPSDEREHMPSEPQPAAVTPTPPKTPSKMRYLVIAVDEAISREDKLCKLALVLANDNEEACKLAQPVIAVRKGNGFFPVTSFSEADLQNAQADLAQAELSDENPVQIV